MKKFQNKKSGFSMLELVVVMLIMGTLAGIRISKMGGSDVGAIKASVKSDMRGAIAAINACYADTLNYASCLGDAGLDLTIGAETALSKSNYKIALTSGNSGKISNVTVKEFPSITITNVNLPTTENTLKYDKNSTSIGAFIRKE